MTTIFKSQIDFFNFNLFVTMRGFIELLTDLLVLSNNCLDEKL